MLMINLLRAILILAGVSGYHIYNKEFLTPDQGLVVFAIAFSGLMLKEILEDYMIRQFNPDEDPSDQTYYGKRPR